MVSINNRQFDELLRHAIDTIPKKYANKIDNVAFVVDDIPSETQRAKLQLRSDQTLFGLYEGIPLTKRNGNYNLVLPDKITIFRVPILNSCQTLAEAQRLISRTVWHEVAHYFGLDHERIDAIEQDNKNTA